MEFINMHRVLLVFSVLVVIFEICDSQIGAQSLYSKRYDDLDIDAILASPRLVTNYVECLLNRKPCPPEGKELKRILPEALRTKCSRCWPNQKEGALKVITKLYYDYPKQYLALRERWDPTGEYHRRFEEYLRDHQFNVISGNGLDGDINRGDQSQITEQVSPPDPSRRPVQVTPQIQSTTSRVINPELTQRPIRQNDNETPIVQRDEQPSFIATRFGDDSASVPDSTTRRQIPPPTTQPPTQSGPTTQRPPQMPSSNNGIGNTDPTYTATVSTFKTRNPILNLINRLSLKFTNTAEFLAGMIRGTVKVKLGSFKVLHYQ
ncbi:uncharacterized protein LOC119659567 isoform X1 [Hermetia illucens]|uniref:uncharacterized protein LOC119659567 isoform X1 n=1 Tax=Hermetia illucens TaxID=343691 RepID=UPI0018CC552B|nr:uncharacterized protein LOC119659567 isoform X1 [Hermetia illucens]XP_037923646.1 uncharacterized protein LOC119659567 isoform X1 [Hermetia illucens]